MKRFPVQQKKWGTLVEGPYPAVKSMQCVYGG